MKIRLSHLICDILDNTSFSKDNDTNLYQTYIHLGSIVDIVSQRLINVLNIAITNNKIHVEPIIDTDLNTDIDIKHLDRIIASVNGGIFIYAITSDNKLIYEKIYRCGNNIDTRSTFAYFIDDETAMECLRVCFPDKNFDEITTMLIKFLVT